MSGKGSVEENCIHHSKGNCIFHAGFVTKCTLCFNFRSVVNVAGKGKTKPVYNFFDYLKSTGRGNVLFPEGDEVQTTL